MERSDEPYADPSWETQAQLAFEDQGYEAWESWNPCPDGRTSCQRCYINYATYLAHKAIRGLDA